MTTTASMAEVAALVGDPARASMMQALMDGRALTSGELARVAGITPQTASGHLTQLTRTGLLIVRAQGRSRYFALASPQVAHLLESLMLVAAGTATPRIHTGPRDEAMRAARTCYDHLAGRLGVAIAVTSVQRGWIDLQDDVGLVTPAGSRAIADIGIPLQPVLAAGSAKPHRGAPLCKVCLDWSERRPHLAGKLGAAICTHALEKGWVRRRIGTRALDITPVGGRALRAWLGVDFALAK